MKLDPPSDLQSNVSSGSCVLTWSVSPALEPLASLFSYELAFKRQEEAWEVTLGLAAVAPLCLSWEQRHRAVPHSTRGDADSELGEGEVTRAKSMCVQACTCV